MPILLLARVCPWERGEAEGNFTLGAAVLSCTNLRWCLSILLTLAVEQMVKMQILSLKSMKDI